jgi:hypothetical protein
MHPFRLFKSQGLSQNAIALEKVRKIYYFRKVNYWCGFCWPLKDVYMKITKTTWNYEKFSDTLKKRDYQDGDSFLDPGMANLAIKI